MNDNERSNTVRGKSQANEGDVVTDSALQSQPDHPQSSAPAVWRSMEEYAADPEFLGRVQREFAPGAEFWLDQPSRRAFLKRMGASFALAGLTGCFNQPDEQIVPYVRTPENMVPGRPQFYATAMPQPGGAIGILAESHEGRPTKIEGNPDHPISLGATDAFTQASVLDLYDPHRSRTVRRNKNIGSWSEFISALKPRLEDHRTRQGAGLTLLTGEVLSPTLRSQLQDVFEAFPQAKWYAYEPSRSSSADAGSQAAFGQIVRSRYHLNDADVIFALDANIFGEGPDRVRLAREFAGRRHVPEDSQGAMNRLYVAETTPTITGSKADHWLRLPPEDLQQLLLALARELQVDVGALSDSATELDETRRHWVQVLAGDLREAGARSAVLVGDTQPAAVQTLVLLINQQLGNVGTTVTYLTPLGSMGDRQPGTLEDLSQAWESGEVETFLILGVDLLYSAPADLAFADKLANRDILTVHHGLHFDQTAAACIWHIPATHYLEEWSDTTASDGTVSLIQPLIRPLYEGRSQHAVLNLLLDRAQQTDYDTLRSYWSEQLDGPESSRWQGALQKGVMSETSAEPVEVTVADSAAANLAGAWPKSQLAQGEMDVVFRTDPSLFDGRYCTNGWLQELPQPFSKLTWGSAAWISPATAEELQVKSGQVVAVTRGERRVDVPVWVQPGQPDRVITLWTGHGRQIEGFETVGVNVGALRSSQAMWRTTGTVVPTGKKVVLPATQHHHSMEGRDLIRAGTLEEVQANPQHPAFMNVLHHGGGHESEEHKTETPPATAESNSDHQQDASEHGGHARNISHPPSLYPDWPLEGDQWGMVVNLEACTGCNACVIACQSENNIPVVGADQVSRGREMHWLRIDSYFVGEPEAPEVHHQPVMCMHCEHAPCEPVCPVGATTHSESGLNEMTYNRCIGTRYCSNNCPYKVRRFNFLDYRSEEELLPVLQLHENPDVTVRSRGVMEKCNYCVQRINGARINAKMDDRAIADGEVVTACQAVCPSQAITFGNVADANSAVTVQKESPLNYALLTELGTRPRTSYLAVVRNPHPDLQSREHA